MEQRYAVLGLLGPSPAPVTVRKFADAQLQGAIDRAIAGLPPDTKAADLTIGFDQRGVQVIGAVKLDHGWSLLGGVSWDTTGEWGGKVSVRRAWK